METGEKRDIEGYELRPDLRWFAEEMERVLRENDHKSSIATYALFNKMVRETYELNIALSKVNLFKPELSPETFRKQAVKEATDVANYAMMIAKSIW